jgi:hypothetical protein
MFVTDSHSISYAETRAVFDVVLDQASDVRSCGPQGSADSGRNLSIVTKTLKTDFISMCRYSDPAAGHEVGC